MSDETKKVDPKELKKGDVEVPKTPLLKGHRNKVTALPLAKLKVGLENLEQEMNARFRAIADANMKQLQYFYQLIQQTKNDLQIYDEVATAVVDILVAKKVVTKDEFEEAVDKVIERKVVTKDEQEDKQMKRKIVDRESKEGDIVCIDFNGTCEDEKFGGGDGLAVNITLGSKSLVEGFEDQLIGKKSGDEFVVKVTAPEKYPENLRNKELVFDVKVRSVKETIQPEPVEEKKPEEKEKNQDEEKDIKKENEEEKQD